MTTSNQNDKFGQNQEHYIKNLQIVKRQNSNKTSDGLMNCYKGVVSNLNFVQKLYVKVCSSKHIKGPVTPNSSIQKLEKAKIYKKRY